MQVICCSSSAHLSHGSLPHVMAASWSWTWHTSTSNGAGQHCGTRGSPPPAIFPPPFLGMEAGQCLTCADTIHRPPSRFLSSTFGTTAEAHDPLWGAGWVGWVGGWMPVDDWQDHCVEARPSALHPDVRSQSDQRATPGAFSAPVVGASLPSRLFCPTIMRFGRYQVVLCLGARV